MAGAIFLPSKNDEVNGVFRSTVINVDDMNITFTGISYIQSNSLF
jgi:hypothetical protein